MECQTKFNNLTVWEDFTDMFDYMPIAATIDNTVFAVHGGLSPSI
jgi:diadenosine tetraphosphatase ApaH/serine/threonine PP2A family protein phosphatase